MGTAKTGLEGLALIPDIQPDVICTDFFMPYMNGLEFTSEVMLHYPRPILVVSASVQEEEDTHRIFQLLEAGAVDILPKPKAGLDDENLRLKQALISKIKILSGVKVFKKKQRRGKPPYSQTASAQVSKSVEFSSRPKILAVGSSTGGPLALQSVLASFSADFPLPIVCVQHISRGFLEGLIDWLAGSCHLPIQIAPAGERPKPGNIYFPPERQHLRINRAGRFAHSQSPPIDGHCPSVTTLFESIAEFYGQRTIGVLLTGMGREGADGMKASTDAGGLTIAQDEATSVVFGMPKEAIDLGAAHHVLPIQSIGPTVLEVVQQF